MIWLLFDLDDLRLLTYSKDVAAITVAWLDEWLVSRHECAVVPCVANHHQRPIILN